VVPGLIQLTEPADDTAHDIASGEGNVDVEGLHIGESGALEENDRVSENRVTTQDLGRPHDAVLA